MPLIVDAYNAMHVWRNAPLEEDGRDVEAMARRIGRSRWAGDKVTVVCDGTPPGGSDGRHRFHVDGVIVVYAGAGVEADEVIERLIAKDSAPKRLTVVSSDHRIRKAASKRGAAAMVSEKFVTLMETDAAAGGGKQAGSENGPDEALEGREVNDWMRAFGFEGRVSEEKKPDGKQSKDGLGDLDMDGWMDGVDKL